MDMIPVTWAFKRIPYLQVLEVRGETTNSKGWDILLKCGLEFIELSEKFNARLLPEEPTEKSKSAVAIYFSLVFPTDEDINNFTRAIQWE